LNGYEVQN
jgi:hypothetical protein